MTSGHSVSIWPVLMLPSGQCSCNTQISPNFLCLLVSVSVSRLWSIANTDMLSLVANCFDAWKMFIWSLHFVECFWQLLTVYKSDMVSFLPRVWPAHFLWPIRVKSVSKSWYLCPAPESWRRLNGAGRSRTGASSVPAWRRSPTSLVTVTLLVADGSNVAAPLTAKLRLVAVRARGTSRMPVAADRRCWRPEMAVAATRWSLR